MTLTKEMMFHITAGTAITGTIFVVLLNSGTSDLDELDIEVFAKARLSNGMILLTYSVHNTGDFDIISYTISAECCSHTKHYTKTINVLNSEKFLEVIKLPAGKKNKNIGDVVVIQVDAYDQSDIKHNNTRHAVDIVGIQLK